MSIIPSSKPANPKVINQLPTTEGQTKAASNADAQVPGGPKKASANPAPDSRAATISTAATGSKTATKASSTESGSKPSNQAASNTGPLPSPAPQTAKVLSVENLTQAQIKQLSQDIFRNLPAPAAASRLIMAQLKVINTQVQVITQLPLKAGQQIQVQNQSGALQLLPQTLNQSQQISQQLSLFMPMIQPGKDNLQSLLNLLKAPLPTSVKEALSKTLELPNLKQLTQVDTIRLQIQQNGSSVEARLKTLITQMQTQTSNQGERTSSGTQPPQVNTAKQPPAFEAPKSSATAITAAINKLAQKVTSVALQQPTVASLKNEIQQLAQGLSKSIPPGTTPLLTGQQTSPQPLANTGKLKPSAVIDNTNKTRMSPTMIDSHKSQLLSTLHQSISHLSQQSSDKNIQQTTQLLLNSSTKQQATGFKLAQPQILLLNLLQQLRPSNQNDNDSDKAIKQLIRLLAGSLANINTQQLNSAQIRQHAEPGLAQWQMDLPYIEQQQAGNIQLEIERKQHLEDQQQEQLEKQHQWKLTLSFDIEPLGCFYAQIQHDQQTCVQFLCENPKSLSLMQKELGHLKSRLEELGITVGTLECKKGSPQQKSLHFSHHLVDIHT